MPNSNVNFMLYMTPEQRKKYMNLFKSIAASGNVNALKQLINMHSNAGKVNISKLTVPKLKNLAKRHGIHIHSKMKKANIIRKLRGQ